MGGRIAGFDGYLPSHELPAREEPVRKVYDDFGRTTTDQFLTGERGFWLVSFERRHATPNPWHSIPRARLEQTFAQTLADSGLAPELKGQKIEIASPLNFPRVHCTVELDRKSRLTDREVYQMFAAAWPAKIPIPPLTVALDISTAKPAPKAELGSATPLKRLFEVEAGGQVQVRAERFSPQEKQRLKRWAGTVTPGAQKQTPARQLLALLSSPTDLSTAAGRATVGALQELNLFSSFWNAGIELLAARFKPRQLERSMFVYNGHPTFAMTSLLPTLNAFAPAATNLWVSKRSGTHEAREIIRIQKPTAMFAESKFTDNKKTIADFLDQKLRMPQEDWGPFHMIVDKLGPWIEKRKRNFVEGPAHVLPKQIIRGEIRAIVHNRDDIDAMKGLEDLLWGVDFANSEVKKTEARFIGEQFALMAAREARVKGWGRIGDVPVVINGFGLLGEQAALAMSRLGLPRENILIRDQNPEVLARAQKAGFRIEGPRPERAVVINGTPGAGITGANIHELGDDLIILSMTSGGKGVDLAGYPAREAPVARSSQQPIKDLDLEIPRAEGKIIRARLIAEGQPPNLVDEMWGDRYQLTSMGVSAATLQAAELDRPGVAVFDKKLDADLVEAARAAGLFELRPLEARPGEDIRDLIADLEAFTPTPKL